MLARRGVRHCVDFLYPLSAPRRAPKRPASPAGARGRRRNGGRRENSCGKMDTYLLRLIVPARPSGPDHLVQDNADIDRSAQTDKSKQQVKRLRAIRMGLLAQAYKRQEEAKTKKADCTKHRAPRSFGLFHEDLSKWL